MKKPEVFISYSWDSEAHKTWVSELALKLQHLGIKVNLDQSAVQAGDHIKSYMEKAIKKADFVLMVFTPAYKEKVKDRETGSGFEYDIISHSLGIDPDENNKFIPILRSGTKEESMPEFMRDYMFIDMCDDDAFQAGIDDLFRRLHNVKRTIQTVLDMQDDTGHIPSDGIDVVNAKLRKQMVQYINSIFDLRSGWSSENRKEACQTKLAEWEAEIDGYTKEFKQYFSLDLFDKIYHKRPQAFKQDVMKHLWTVGAALRDPSEELVKYKMTYNKCIPESVFNCVNGILQNANTYTSTKGKGVEMTKLSAPDELQHDFLNEDGMILSGVIGQGIRSEILHRSWPSHFSIMTRKTLWGMFFLTEQSLEFLRYEKDQKKRTRLTNQYDYDYALFNYYSAVVGQHIHEFLKEFGMELKPEYWMGYSNMFLRAVSKENYRHKKELNTWI